MVKEPVRLLQTIQVSHHGQRGAIQIRGIPGCPEGLHLHEIYCSVPGLKGLQFTTAGDWEGEIRKVVERRIVYLNTLPREPGEPLADYFRRLVSLCDGRRGMIPRAGRIDPGERPGAMDTWRAVQDEVLG